MTNIKSLQTRYKPLNPEKLDKRLEFLHRMAVYYNEHLEETQPGQAALFRSYIVALLYAETIINKYDELTKELERCE